MKNIHTSYALISNDKWISNFSQCWLWLVPTVNCQQDISRLARFFIIIRTPIFIRLPSMGLDLVTAACRLLLCPSAPLFDLCCPCFCCCLFAPHHNPPDQTLFPFASHRLAVIGLEAFLFCGFPPIFPGFCFSVLFRFQSVCFTQLFRRTSFCLLAFNLHATIAMATQKCSGRN